MKRVLKGVEIKVTERPGKISCGAGSKTQVIFQRAYDFTLAAREIG